MKKFLFAFLFAAMIFVFVAGLLFAGVDDRVYVFISNVEVASGGNAAVNGPHKVDVVKSKEYIANSHPGFSFEEVYAHEKFQSVTGDKNSDYYRSKNYPGPSAVFIAPKAKQVARIKANTVPSKKVLLNANAPIMITSFSDEVILNFGRNADDCGTEYVRILDDKGKAIATLQGRAGGRYGSELEKNSVEVKLSPSYKNYYLEIKDYNYGRNGKFYYVLLQMRSTQYPAKENPDLAKYDRDDEKSRSLHQEIMNDYMKQHNIKNQHDLTEADYEKIFEIIHEREMETKSPIDRKMNKAFDDYVKQHGIKDTTKLTQKDLDAIGKIFEASLTPAERKRLDDEDNIRDAYMKRHSIRDESEMTQKDWIEVQKEIERTLGKN